ncbi:MAG: TraR/DksA C4-type zinc finger protein [Pseudomonadota bacterium]|nr:TraR/DksA C4-type zinc finger protein [Pseudomonadota bacterium]
MFEERREELLKLQQELRDRVSRARRDLMSSRSKDWEEQATERENDEVLQALVKEGELELAQIHHALQRIEDETYGVCKTCGEEIQPRRLQAMLYSTLCIKCAEKQQAGR